MSIHDLISRLVVSIRTIQTHGLDHKAVNHSVRQLADTINHQIETDRVPLRMEETRGEIYIAGQPAGGFREDSGLFWTQLGVLRGLFRERKISGIVFEQPVEPFALRTWLGVFARQITSEATLPSFHKALSLLSAFGIRCLGYAASTPGSTSTDQLHRTLIESFDPAVSQLKEGNWSAPSALATLSTTASDRPVEVIHLLLSPQKEKPYSAQHAANTALWSILLGRMLRIEGPRLPELGAAAWFADMGFALVNGPPKQAEGLFTLTEREAYRGSMVTAIRPLAESSSLDPSVHRRLVVACEHHRPHKGAHPYSRIVSVADAFDAMITARPWRPAMGKPQALATLEYEKERFDPVVVSSLMALLRGYDPTFVY